MHIVLCFDNNFIMQCGVLITSIMRTNPNTKITFHILSSGLSDENKKQIQTITAGTTFEIIFYQFDPALVKNLPLYRNDYITLATYFRLFIPSILPKTISKVLYLDCDMIAADSLENLWNTDINAYPIAAAIDYYYDDIRNFNRLEYNSANGYFNAGMMLINLDYWRANNTTDNLLSFIQNNSEKCKSHDQDALNHIFADKWLRISTRFNLMDGYLYSSLESLLIRKELHDEIVTAINNPVIIHFAGPVKPWHKECFNPYKEIWLFLKKTSPWKNKHIVHKYHGKQLIKYQLRRFLEIIHLIDDKSHSVTDLSPTITAIYKRIR